MQKGLGRAGYVFLCVAPFLNLAVAGTRSLRPAHLAVGSILFVAIAAAAWAAGARTLGPGQSESGQLALAGVLLLLPFAIISLLWVGIGAPFQATLPENHMRFVVLVADSILVTGGFVVLWGALHDAGELLISTLGLAASVCAGTAYFICLNISLAQVALRLRGDRTPLPPIVGTFYDAVEFFACLMTYLTIAVFATSLCRARILGRGAAVAYATASAVLMLFLIMRGFEYPEISGRTAPWYTQPGVIAGIPAIPWLMPSLMGALLVRRAGEKPAR
jgi:hypothetical protein